MIGSLLKEADGQVTLQAQTENGIVDLLVCDYLRGELRGYVRHDPDRLAEAGPNPSLFALFGKGYLAITFDHPEMDERYQGIVPLEGASLAEAAQSFFAQSEQIPSLVRLAAEKRDGHVVRAAACCSSTCPKAKKAATGFTPGSTIPTGRTSRCSPVRSRTSELTDPELPLDDLVWRLFHEEDEVRDAAVGRAEPGVPLRSGLRPLGDRQVSRRRARRE